MKKIIRVFPTRTNATPNDELARIRETPSLFDEADEVHISVTFTWDFVGRMGCKTMGARGSCEDRRTCIQRAWRRVCSGDVYEARICYHFARLS